jgi:hypothetical protein
VTGVYNPTSEIFNPNSKEYNIYMGGVSNMKEISTKVSNLF